MEPSGIPIKSGRNKALYPAKPSIISKAPTIFPDIESADLASRRESEQYAKNVPRDFRKLNHLHEKVTKGSMMTRKNPTFEFKHWDQPELSFLDNATTAGGSSDKPSTDYDEDWMDGLPSPSALLGKQDKAKETAKASSFYEKLTDYGSDWPSGLPSPSANLRQNDAAIESYAETDSLEDFDLSQFNDDQADVEDALVGFSGSVAKHENSQTGAMTASTNLRISDINAEEHSSQDDYLPKIFGNPTNRAKTSVKSDGSSRLFLSTDSPEKQLEQPLKRKAIALESEDVSLSAPVLKKPKPNVEIDQALQPCTEAENQAPPPVPKIKPGQPAWVYDFDPSFIAEWQDFVEFV